jgi:hypothetical protein
MVKLCNILYIRIILEFAQKLGIASQRYSLATGSDKAMPYRAIFCSESEDCYQGLDMS